MHLLAAGQLGQHPRGELVPRLVQEQARLALVQLGRRAVLPPRRQRVGHIRPHEPGAAHAAAARVARRRRAAQLGVQLLVQILRRSGQAGSALPSRV